MQELRRACGITALLARSQLSWIAFECSSPHRYRLNLCSAGDTAVCGLRSAEVWTLMLWI